MAQTTIDRLIVNSPCEEPQRLFFCQLEAVETLIWLTEAPPAQRGH
jgi:hypothetical protein